MDNNIIILDDIVKMSDRKTEDIKIEQPENNLNTQEKTEQPENSPKSDIPPNTDKKSAPEIGLNKEEFEQALEKIIKKLFADKIDAILEKVIEDTVTKEIKILKQNLTE